MSFVTPLYLWLLLALLPLFFLQIRKKTKQNIVVVPHLQFWIDEEKSESPFSYIIKIAYQSRWPLAFTLFLLLIFALANPKTGVVYKRQSLVILVDNSASMATLEGEQNRCSIALDIIKKLLPQFDCTIITTSPEVAIVPSAQLDKITPSTKQNDWKQIHQTISQLKTDIFLLISDSCEANWQQHYQKIQNLYGEKLYTYIIGSQKTNHHTRFIAAQNSGIQLYSSAGEIQWNVAVQNPPQLFQYFPEPYLQSQKVSAGMHPLNLPSDSGWFEVVLYPLDDFPYDNRFFYYSPSNKKAKVLLISKTPQPYIISALGAYQHLIDTQNSGAAQQIPEKSEYDLVIVCDDDFRLPEDNRGKFLFWRTQNIFPTLGVSSDHIIWKTQSSHRLCQDVNFSQLRIKKAIIAQPQEVIVEGNKGPLVWLGKHQNIEYVFCAFRIEDSQLPDSPSFPIFMRNVIQWSIGFPQQQFPYALQIPEEESLISPQLRMQQLPLIPPANTRKYYDAWLLWATLVLISLFLLWGIVNRKH